MKRKDPSLSEIAAAAILQLFNIPRDHAKLMTTAQILSLVHRDHDPVPYAIARDLGWGSDRYNHPSNLTLRLVPDHREKTAKRDIPAIAKTDRIAPAQAEFRRRMLRKTEVVEDDEAPVKPGRRLQGRGFQKSTVKQKIKSRPFQKRGKSNGTDEEERS
jgi:hypothetical protein